MKFHKFLDDCIKIDAVYISVQGSEDGWLKTTWSITPEFKLRYMTEGGAVWIIKDLRVSMRDGTILLDGGGDWEVEFNLDDELPEGRIKLYQLIVSEQPIIP